MFPPTDWCPKRIRFPARVFQADSGTFPKSGGDGFDGLMFPPQDVVMIAINAKPAM
jgi:hypothetical protein